MTCKGYESSLKETWHDSIAKEKSRANKTRIYLLVNKCCVCLCFSLITVNRALQGVDDMVVRVVLIIVQYTVVCIFFCPVRMEKDVDKVRLTALQ